jgi:hypothetical protein
VRFDHEKFFAGWRQSFGALRPDQVASIEALLAALESDPHVTDVRWAAYMLATAYHETAATMAPIDEFGSDKYFDTRYGPGTAVGKRLGNTRPKDGSLFHGRGFVQLTGRRNHHVMSQRLRDSYGQVVDLEANPERAKDTLTAYRIMSLGMRDGLFTGRSLRHYINGAKCDYVNARRIINGTDKAQAIAGYAAKFERILRASAETAPLPAPAEPDAPVAASLATKATLIGGGAVATAGGAAVATSGAEIPWIVWAVVGVIVSGVVAMALLWWLSREKS